MHSGEHLPQYVGAEGGSSPAVLIPTNEREMKQHILHLRDTTTRDLNPLEIAFLFSFFLTLPDWIL